MPLVTFFGMRKIFSNSFSCSVSDLTNFSIRGSESIKCGCRCALSFRRSQTLSASEDLICETTNGFPTKIDSIICFGVWKISGLVVALALSLILLQN